MSSNSSGVARPPSGQSKPYSCVPMMKRAGFGWVRMKAMILATQVASEIGPAGLVAQWRSQAITNSRSQIAASAA